VLQLFDPSESEIVRYLQQHVSDAMLSTIAGFAYGCNVEEYLAHLVKIRSGDRVPDIATLMPREVLQLTSHADPDERPVELFSEPYPGGVGPPEAVREGHIGRLFACASLLRSSTTERDAGYNDDSYLTMQAVQSAIALGDESIMPLRKLLACRLQFVTGYDYETAFGCGILILSEFEGTSLALRARLAEAIEAAEFGMVDGANPRPDHWTFLGRCFRGEGWIPLIEKHLCGASSAEYPQEAQRLALLGRRLLRGR
jgi:hypothetical protein